MGSVNPTGSLDDSIPCGVFTMDCQWVGGEIPGLLFFHQGRCVEHQADRGEIHRLEAMKVVCAVVYRCDRTGSQNLLGKALKSDERGIAHRLLHPVVPDLDTAMNNQKRTVSVRVVMHWQRGKAVNSDQRQVVLLVMG